MAETLIVGGGPAGAALGVRLGLAGREVLLLERLAGPNDKVCGEFLSPETSPFFRTVGIDLRALGAETIRGVRLATHSIIAEVPLPQPAHSLSRKVLDEALLERASAAGVMKRTVETSEGDN